VADLDQVVDDQRPGGQGRQPLAVLVGQGVEGPTDGVAGHGVEAFGTFEAGADLVVVAANQGVRRQGAHALADGVGVGAVADQVTQHEHLVVLQRLGLGHHGLVGLEVGVYVADDQVAHQGVRNSAP
jgi:hypothetical protein